MSRHKSAFRLQMRRRLFRRRATISARISGLGNIAAVLGIGIRRLQQLRNPEHPDYDARVRRGIAKSSDPRSGRRVFVANLRYLAALRGNRDRERAAAQKQNASKPRPSRRKGATS